MLVCSLRASTYVTIKLLIYSSFSFSFFFPAPPFFPFNFVVLNISDYYYISIFFFRCQQYIYVYEERSEICPSAIQFILTTIQEKGPHLYTIDPSSNYADCKAMAIGARSQSAKTYLERHVDSLPNTGALNWASFKSLSFL